MTDDFVPTNDLEEALVRAATDASARPDFYRRLVEADLLFLTAQPAAPTGPRSYDPTAKVDLLSWEGPKGAFIPCFSSQERLEEVVERTGDSGGSIAIPGRNAFQLLAQMPGEAFLNPGLGYGKRFVAKEIRRLADGTIFQAVRALVERQRDDGGGGEAGLDGLGTPSYVTDGDDDLDDQPTPQPQRGGGDHPRPPATDWADATPPPRATPAPRPTSSDSNPVISPGAPPPGGRPGREQAPPAMSAESLSALTLPRRKPWWKFW